MDGTNTYAKLAVWILANASFAFALVSMTYACVALAKDDARMIRRSRILSIFAVLLASTVLVLSFTVNR